MSGAPLPAAAAGTDTVALTDPFVAVGVPGVDGVVTVGAAVATEPTCAAVRAVLLQIFKS